MRTISQWWQGTKAFALLRAKEALGCEVLVSAERSANRARACADFDGRPCSQNVMPTKSTWVEGWANGKMRERIGWATTPHDEKIGICKACSCELRTIVHFETDILRETTPTTLLARLPAHCWKKKELV